jgi:SAM-dependent methyltransferase
VSSAYDAFAWFYDRYWAAPFQAWQAPALEKLLFPELAPGARILDLCCGTGELSRRFSARGYDVIGIDSSEEMLRLARRNAPGCAFLQADATQFILGRQVDAVVCTFDSLNHLLQVEDVALAVRNVYAALVHGGRFVFDINTKAAYGRQWDQSACEVAPDHAFFLRGGFDEITRIGSTKVTMFRLQECWQRSDVEILQRPWEVAEIHRLLTSTGFAQISSDRAFEDLGIDGHYGDGRVYFSACRNSNEQNALS